jgi:radical SAM protein with 4Fe4S-binding SPASM domain
MSIDKFEFIFNKIKELKGNNSIIITGGEPFANFGTLLYGLKLNENSQNTFMTINTNFTMQTNLLQRIKDETNELCSLFISVPSMKRDLYNKITCTNNFDLLIDNLKFVRDNKEHFEVAANIVVSKLNYNDVIPTINKLLLYGVNKIKVSKMLPIFTEHKTINDIVINDEETIEIYDKILKLQDKNSNFSFLGSATCIPTCTFPNETKFKQFNSVCSAGKGLLAITPIGNIKPCPSLPDKFCIGNIFEDSLSDIIKSGDTFYINQKARFKECYDCELYKSNKCMGGCLVQPLFSTQNEEALIPFLDNKDNILKVKSNLV